MSGTIHTAAAEIEVAGGSALAVVGDVRDEESVQRAVERGVGRFRGIDIVVNNASALAVDGTDTLTMKRFDLMTDIQLRGTDLLSSKALPHLCKGTNLQILSLSPPFNLSPTWLGGDAAIDRSRSPEIVADAAVTILERPAGECTGNTFLDVEVLRDAGVTDLSSYGGTGYLEYDIFVDRPR
ncbi:SDR family NAD(P)-dependent oxidoreductase [Streptomyces sp. NPDC058175]|uniref:SDR family NAD(P)-dependent oxidoreductase n=1 Tax=Streptomyces sp. NPDC058175 TaxID=3346367 RepID=UPI0036E064D7